MLPPVAVSLYFPVVWNCTLGETSGFVSRLKSNSYQGFIFPLPVASSSLSGAGIAVRNLVWGLKSGEFDKLPLIPIDRSALLSRAVLSGGVIQGLQTAIVLGVGLLLSFAMPVLRLYTLSVRTLRI